MPVRSYNLDQKIKTDVGMETAAETLARSKAMVTTPPPPTPLTTPEGTIKAENLGMGGTPPLPSPTAPEVQNTMQVGLQTTKDNAEKTVMDTLTKQRDEALTRRDEINTKLETLMKDQDPTKRATYVQEQSILENQLQAAETVSSNLETDYTKRRGIVAELDKLLTEGNYLIERSKLAPVSQQVLNKSVSRSMQDVQARAGVLQAVVTALDGNITSAHSILSNARVAVAADWNDKVAYNKAYLELVESGQLAKNDIHADFAKSELAIAENKLSEVQKTYDYLQELMINPESAQFIADAGVTLTDSVEEIKTKMSAEAARKEVTYTINELKQEGYEYVPFAEGRDDVVSLEVGGKTLYFVPPKSVLNDWNDIDPYKDKAGGGGGPAKFTPTQKNKLEAEFGPDWMETTTREEQLAYLYGDDPGSTDLQTFEEFVAEAEQEARMSFGPEAREAMREEYNRSVSQYYQDNPPETKYTTTTIPTFVREQLISDINSDVTLDELYANYPDVSSAYISSTYNSLKKKKKTETGLTQEEAMAQLDAMMN